MIRQLISLTCDTDDCKKTAGSIFDAGREQQLLGIAQRMGTIGQALRSRDWHDICFWGEAAARIAETPSQWQGDPDECAQGCPTQCRHQRAADALTALDEELGIYDQRREQK